MICSVPKNAIVYVASLLDQPMFNVKNNSRPLAQFVSDPRDGCKKKLVLVTAPKPTREPRGLRCVIGDGFGYIERRRFTSHVVRAYLTLSDHARDCRLKTGCHFSFFEPIEHQLRC
jgi:hypothetical protein